MRTRLALGTVVAVIFVQSIMHAQPARARLLGSWRLVKYDSFAADGSTRPGPFDTGVVSYDPSGQMSAHLWRAAGRATTSPRTDAERAAAYQSYLGYYGPFDVDETKGTVVHHVRGSSYPDWVGSEQLRYYELDPDGRHLTLSVKNAERVTGRLLWERQ